MSDEFDIEVKEQSQPQIEGASVQLPMNFLTFGEIESDDVKVYIKLQAKFSTIFS